MGEARLFLVRVWQDADGAHAAARDVREDLEQRFDEAHALGRWLFMPASPTAAQERR